MPSIEDLRKTRDRIRELAAQIPGANDAELIKIRAELREALAAEGQRVEETIAHSPRITDSVIDVDFEGMRPSRPPRFIRQVDDGYGNLLYTTGKDTLNRHVLLSLIGRVNEQRQRFEGLSEEEQSKIQEEFDLNAVRSTIVSPYLDYLVSEELGRRFRELKQNPPNPFGKR